MPFANGTAVKLYICEETAGALPGTPAWLPVRFVSHDLHRETKQIPSNEIRSDRQSEVDRQGTYNTLGSIAAEMGLALHDDLIQAALQGTWAPKATKVAGTISAQALDNSFNDSGNGFILAGFEVGDRVISSGFTGNVANNLATGRVITALTAGKMTFGGTDGDDIVDDAAGETVTLTTKADVVRIGSTRRTFAVLERHTDLSLDYIYRNCEIASWGIRGAIDARVPMTFGVIGRVHEAYVVGSDTFATATENDPFVTTDASLTEGGSAFAIATEFAINLDNGMAPNFAIGARAAVDISNGRARVSGNLSAYFSSATLYAKFLAETSSSFKATLTDGTDTISIELPKTIYTQGGKPVQGPGSIVAQLGFAAGLDANTRTVTVTRTSP